MSNALSAHWQPIATAPSDQDILVFSHRWGVIIATFRPEFGAWFPRMQCPAAFGHDDADLISHWMPLPTTPAVGQDGATQPVAATGLPPTLARFLIRARDRSAA